LTKWPTAQNKAHPFSDASYNRCWSHGLCIPIQVLREDFL